jgi:hypothetical protein
MSPEVAPIGGSRQRNVMPAMEGNVLQNSFWITDDEISGL